MQDLVSFLVEQFPLGNLRKGVFRAGARHGGEVNWELSLPAAGRARGRGSPACPGVSIPAAAGGQRRQIQLISPRGNSAEQGWQGQC